MSNSGTVKKWVGPKGYGFIIPDDGSEEIFAHHSDIGGVSLVEGGKVKYDTASNTTGTHSLKAINITGALGPRISPDAGKGKDAGKGGKGKDAGKGKGKGKDAGWGAPAQVWAQPAAGGWGAPVVATVSAVPAKGKGKGAVVKGTPKGKGGKAPAPTAYEEHGYVKNWNEDKGFGFITTDAGDDVFYHIMACDGNLVKDQEVWFTRGISPKNGKPWAECLRGPGFKGKPQNGTVKNWNEEKGFGFITPTPGEKSTVTPRADGQPGDLFVHITQIEKAKHDGTSLLAGAAVSYSVGVQPNGKQWAMDVSGPGVLRNGVPESAESAPAAATPAAAAAAPAGIAVGGPCEANFNGTWFAATVVSVDAAGTEVKWDSDGTTTSGLPAAMIRAVGGATGQPY